MDPAASAGRVGVGPERPAVRALQSAAPNRIGRGVAERSTRAEGRRAGSLSLYRGYAAVCLLADVRDVGEPLMLARLMGLAEEATLGEVNDMRQRVLATRFAGCATDVSSYRSETRSGEQRCRDERCDDTHGLSTS